MFILTRVLIVTIILPAKVTAGEEVLVISRAESRAIQDYQELFSCKSVKLLDDADDDDDDTRDNWWTEIRREVRAIQIHSIFLRMITILRIVFSKSL